VGRPGPDPAVVSEQLLARPGGVTKTRPLANLLGGMNNHGDQRTMRYNCQGSRTVCIQNYIQQAYAQSLSALQQHSGSCTLCGTPEVGPLLDLLYCPCAGAWLQFMTHDW
jgi:hypothetical protein